MSIGNTRVINEKQTKNTCTKHVNTFVTGMHPKPTLVTTQQQSAALPRVWVHDKKSGSQESKH